MDYSCAFSAPSHVGKARPFLLYHSHPVHSSTLLFSSQVLLNLYLSPNALLLLLSDINVRKKWMNHTSDWWRTDTFCSAGHASSQSHRPPTPERERNIRCWERSVKGPCRMVINEFGHPCNATCQPSLQSSCYQSISLLLSSGFLFEFLHSPPFFFSPPSWMLLRQAPWARALPQETSHTSHHCIQNTATSSLSDAPPTLAIQPRAL